MPNSACAHSWTGYTRTRIEQLLLNAALPSGSSSTAHRGLSVDRAHVRSLHFEQLGGKRSVNPKYPLKLPGAAMRLGIFLQKTSEHQRRRRSCLGREFLMAPSDSVSMVIAVPKNRPAALAYASEFWKRPRELGSCNMHLRARGSGPHPFQPQLGINKLRMYVASM